jgi:2'-5' RNA ligase
MPRFFVAIPLPDEAKNCLIAAQPPVIPGMRVLGREELHLTLHFLGEIAPHHVGVVGNALASVRMNAFAITIRGVGRFPPEGEAQVLWAGAEASAALIEPPVGRIHLRRGPRHFLWELCRYAHHPRGRIGRAGGDKMRL